MAKDLRVRLKKDDLRRLYLEEKKSLEDIGRLYGASRVAVWKYCIAEGLLRRNRSEARLEAQKKAKVPQKYCCINDSFFSVWSPEMAYVFGLLITDGCLSKVKNSSYRISLCLNDADLLKCVAKAMGSDRAMQQSKHQEGLYMFIFGRDKMAHDLIGLGMKPKKSMDIEFPNVPKEYIRDFIRGVFDGDGSVFFEKRSAEYPLRANFVSGSKAFIETLENKLNMLGMPKRNIYQQPTKNGISYMFRYAHRDSETLFDLLYKNAKNNLFLRRKYDKFLEGFKSNG